MLNSTEFFKNVNSNDFDICKLAPFHNKDIQIEEEFIVPHKGASKTIMNFVTLLKKSTNEKTSVVSKVFLKADTVKRYVDDFHYKKLKSLEYEAGIYGFITENILAVNMCPNFVGYIGYAECSFNSYNHMSLLASVGIDTNNNDVKDDIKNGIFKVCILLTHKVKGMSLSEFWKENNIDIDITNQILFQLLYALTVMDKFKIQHNDLHAKNILVEDLKEEITMKYILGGTTYLIETRFILYIFDWDLSYCEMYKDNILLTETCEKTNRCNMFQQNFDLYTVCCILNFPFNRYLYTKNAEFFHEMRKIKIKKQLLDEFRNKYDIIQNPNKPLHLSQSELKKYMNHYEKYFDENLIKGIFMYNDDGLLPYTRPRCRPMYSERNENIPSIILTERFIDYVVPENTLSDFTYNFSNGDNVV